MLPMTKDSRTLRTLIFAVALGGLLALLAPTAQAQSCGWNPDHSPSTLPPSGLWSGLRPADTTGPPTAGNNLRDTTFFDRNGGYSASKPIWQSLDVENNYIFAGFNLGFQIWDATASRTQPTKRANVDVTRNGTLPIFFRNPHNYFIVDDVDAPPGNDDVAAMVGWEGMGFVVWDTTNKTNVRVAYQDGATGGNAKRGSEVYATTINNRDYAFMAAWSLEGGLFSYDLTQAMTVGATQACSEKINPAFPAPLCSGVFQRALSSDPQRHVDGAGSDSQGHFVVFSGGIEVSARGFEIWNVSNPQNPSPVMDGLGNDRAHGVALWKDGSKFYLAVASRFPDVGRIYDVSCIRTGTCTLGAPLFSFPLEGLSASTVATVTYSESNGTPYVYFGRKQGNVIDDLQSEWLFDVSSPSNPREILGGNPNNGNTGQQTQTLEGTTLGYWSYYYACSPEGTNHFEPRMGKFSGEFFYRAGSSIFDIHRLQDVSPTITVVRSGAEDRFIGDTVSFSATAANCTPSPSGWSWTTTGGDIIGSSNGSTIQVQWGSTGVKTVNASNSSCGGANQNSDTVNILDPAPVIGSVTPNVSSASVCQQVTFTANGVDGRAPLTFDWSILNPNNEPISNPSLTISADGRTATWDTGADQPANGNYRAELLVTNSAGDDTATSGPVAITQPAPLAFTGPGGAPSFNVNFGSVDFNALSQGAAEWRWNFGDGTPAVWDDDPVTGPRPTHEYDTEGNYTVSVEIRNCVESTPLQSAEVTVPITDVSPLEITQFKAVCPFGQCFFFTTDNITFQTTVNGDPEQYRYDWDGNGTFEQTSSTPVTTHRYTTTGFYRPRLQVTRGSRTDTFEHAVDIQVTTGQQQNPRLIITGPSTGETGDSLEFRASAVDCTPNANGYSWNTGGGSGSSTSDRITISWTTTGTKTVRVENSGCGNESDTHTVVIREPSTGGGGDLVARYSYAPSAPAAGQEVTFNAGSSTGGPDSYFWDFGDGSTANGRVVTHTFQNNGAYQVQLEVGRDDSSCSFNFCTDVVTQTVAVGGTSGACQPGNETLCLFDGRFDLQVRWKNQRDDNEGTGKVFPFPSDETGMFWFFGPSNVELIVKILDGRTSTGAFWVFYGGLSDVEYWLTVTDTETEESVEYHNLPGTICGQADTEALPDGNVTSGLRLQPMSALSDFSDSGLGSIAAPGGASGTCVESDQTLCLLNGRFAVEVDWINQRVEGDEGEGTAVVGTDETGYFWFFNADNIELVVKMIDATSIDQGYWVFFGALSDLNYFVRVTDTVTQETKVYENQPGNFCGQADTSAF
ncbi:MAG: PKD domain-containing protein [Acidobacteriota bacterium]